MTPSRREQVREPKLEVDKARTFVAATLSV